MKKRPFLQRINSSFDFWFCSVFKIKLLIHNLLFSYTSSMSIFSHVSHKMNPHQFLSTLIKSQWGGETQDGVKIHTSSIPRPPPTHICSPDRKTSVEEDSRLLPLSLHLATNGGYSRLCWGQAASAELICKDWHPDDDFAGVIYSWQDPILSYGRVQLDFDIMLPCWHL